MNRILKSLLIFLLLAAAGFAADTPMAAEYTLMTAEWRKNAEAGDASAQNALGYAYQNNLFGIPKDDVQAVKWYRKAADQGLAVGQYNLGHMYDDGKGVLEDDAEAMKWWRKAADQGNASAQFNLGVMCEYGKSVPKDSLEAVKWYRKAAEQGNVAGMCFLGLIYSQGEGLPKDDAEAVKWYRLAANQGDSVAQHNLGNNYKRGAGVPKDLVQAHVWLNIAVANGGGAWSKTLLANVEEEMTYDQKAEAMKLARELFAKLPKLPKGE